MPAENDTPRSTAYAPNDAARRYPLTWRTRGLFAAHVRWHRNGHGIAGCPDGRTNVVNGPWLPATPAEIHAAARCQTLRHAR